MPRRTRWPTTSSRRETRGRRNGSCMRDGGRIVRSPTRRRARDSKRHCRTSGDGAGAHPARAGDPRPLSGAGMRYAEEAVAAARAAGDGVLAAVAQFRLGVILSYHGRVGAGTARRSEAATRSSKPSPMMPCPTFTACRSDIPARIPRGIPRIGARLQRPLARGVRAARGNAGDGARHVSAICKANGAAAACRVCAFSGRRRRCATAIARRSRSFVDRGGRRGVLADADDRGRHAAAPLPAR